MCSLTKPVTSLEVTFLNGTASIYLVK
uniref:Uncharacterized protein n=1 Tax=Arundo donax TaxID=35708 RepID=A0A0A8YRL0_ARUDO